MMCCIPVGPDEEPNGVCKACGADTFDGAAIDQCAYSPKICEECKHAPCDGSC